MDLIWRSKKIIKFGAARKKIKFGDFCQFAPNFLRAKIYPNKLLKCSLKLWKGLCWPNTSEF